MSLDYKPKGNPNWTPGKSGNPTGRPKGAKNLKTILKVAAMLADKKRHPVHELIRLADEAYRDPAMGGRELASKIWADLLKYCEPQKKAQEVLPEKPATPEESVAAAKATLQMIEDLENGNPSENAEPAGGYSSGLDTGASPLQAQTDTAGAIRQDQGDTGEAVCDELDEERR